VCEKIIIFQSKAVAALTTVRQLAATAPILRRLLAPIAGDVRGLRDRALLLVGFAGALRRSELAAIRFEHLEMTDRGIRLTLPQTKGEQTDAVTVALPYGDTELCPVQVLERWQLAAGVTEGPVFRRIWLPPGRRTGAPPGEPPALPCPASAPRRSRRRPWRRSSRGARWRPVLPATTSAATASSAAR
jgi:integrase